MLRSVSTVCSIAWLSRAMARRASRAGAAALIERQRHLHARSVADFEARHRNRLRSIGLSTREFKVIRIAAPHEARDPRGAIWPLAAFTS
jgi:hypothetical protein